jgi:hypothetical protein
MGLPGIRRSTNKQAKIGSKTLAGIEGNPRILHGMII